MNGALNGQRSALHANSEFKGAEYSNLVAKDIHTINGMEVDGDVTAIIEEQVIPTLKDGHSIAVQSESVKDLASTTSILTVAERDCIMHTVWNPNPQKCILASGGIALCQLHHLANAMSTVDPSRSSILHPQDTSLVTCIAWHPGGQVLAIATRTDASEFTGNVSIWTENGQSIDDLAAGRDMVIKLCFSTDGSLLLGITASGDELSSLIVWIVESGEIFALIHCDQVINHATWSGAASIAVCGQGSIGRLDLSGERAIIWAQKSNNQITERNWSHVFANPNDGSIILFDEESAYAVVINSYGAIDKLQQIHNDSITGISCGASFDLSRSSPIIVTSSLDGTVKIFHINGLQPISTLVFGDGAPPLTVALNQGASLLAAANHNKVLVWDSSGSRIPVGIWQGDLGKNTKGQMTNGHADKDSGIGDESEDGLSESDISLDWDATGTRLALGLGNQACIVCSKAAPCFTDVRM